MEIGRSFTPTGLFRRGNRRAIDIWKTHDS
jgi:hypothetical protein